MIYCGCCGVHTRRKTINGKVYHICRNHDINKTLCSLKQVPEAEIQAAFLRLYYKLKHQGADILPQMAANLQTIRNHRLLWSEAVIKLNKRISSITSQNQLLAMLKQRGGVDPDIFISRSNELTKQLRKAKQERERLLNAERDETLVRTQELIEVIKAGPEFLETFVRELFGELIGYRMELGEVVTHPQEAEVVRDIFRQYILGASYKALVETLQDQAVPYDWDRLWNKNMVARILEDGRYTGEQGWPALIIAETYSHVVEKRSGKTGASQVTEAQKALRRLSGGSSARDLEQSVLCLLNQLIANPEQITAPQQPEAPSRVAELRRALDCELERQPVNDATAKSLVMELASAQYEAIGNQAYESERLRRLFGGMTEMESLDARVLRMSVAVIRVSGGKISVQLKNGQVIERGCVHE